MFACPRFFLTKLLTSLNVRYFNLCLSSSHECSMLEQYAEFLEPYCAGKWHTWVRFGKWHEILKCPLPGGEVDWVPEEGKEERKETEKEQGKETETKQEGNVDEAKAVERADIGGENTNEEGQEGEGEDPQAKGPKKLDLGASFWRTCRATAYYAKGVACAALGDVQGAEQMQAKFASAKAVVRYKELLCIVSYGSKDILKPCLVEVLFYSLIPSHSILCLLTGGP